MNSHSLMGITCSIIALCAYPSYALGQSGPGGTEAAAQGVADIIVTAEKRSTSLQKTPLAVTAFTS